GGATYHKTTRRYWAQGQVRVTRRSASTSKLVFGRLVNRSRRPSAGRSWRSCRVNGRAQAAVPSGTGEIARFWDGRSSRYEHEGPGDQGPQGLPERPCRGARPWF